MPTLTLDARFPGKDKDRIDELKKALDAQFTDKLGDEYEITHQVITHGRPTFGMPEIKPEINGGAFVIRTSVKIPIEDLEMIKEKLGEK